MKPLFGLDVDIVLGSNPFSLHPRAVALEDGCEIKKNRYVKRTPSAKLLSIGNKYEKDFSTGLVQNYKNRYTKCTCLHVSRQIQSFKQPKKTIIGHLLYVMLHCNWFIFMHIFTRMTKKLFGGRID